MSILKKITDFVMPVDEEEEEYEEEEVKEKAASERTVEEEAPVRKAAVAGGGVSYDYSGVSGATSYASRGDNYRPSFVPPADKNVSASSRPQFTVHTTKTQEMSVKVHSPEKFDHVVFIADDIKDNRSVIVNYEGVGPAEQRRICDFMNGLCYVLDGDAKRISANIVLYVPSGVDVSDAMAAAVMH